MTDRQWWIGLGVFTAFVAVYTVAGYAARQEKPESETRSWQAYELPHDVPNGRRFDATRVDVIDTKGVCLYVARSYTGKINYTNSNVAIAAVAKSQLRAGEGCQ